MPYFLYKPQNISNLGGVFPNPQPPEEFTLGITERRGYYLGYTDNPENIHKIKDYFVCWLDDDTAEGFKLLDVTQIPEDPSDPESAMRDLTDDELAKQKKAENLVLKLSFRHKLYSLSNLDLEDMFADLTKRVEMLERLCIRAFYYIFNGQDIPQELKDKYLPLIESAINAIDTEGIQLRVDYEDVSAIFDKIKERAATIDSLVKTEYLDKKVS